METTMKWDGHTHTELCPHGSGNPTEIMIEKAVQQGFTHYSITEHAPLPKGLVKNQKLHDELCLAPNQLEEYFEHVSTLKKKYASDIKILTGLEFDYIAGYEDYTKKLLEQTAPYLDDALLSLHLLKGHDGFRCIDFTSEDFYQGLVTFHGSQQAVHQEYWQQIRSMLTANLGKYKPKRIGHLGLIYKFFLSFPDLLLEEFEAQRDDDSIFKFLKNGEYSLDFNMAGNKVASFQNTYITPKMRLYAQEYQIPIVYGSDAHGEKTVGHYYQLFKEQSQNQKQLIFS
ncbi:MAG: histidinol-phosphatase (PHP family) [bacterium]|jgi:histidinol-phosphatase (PHP family)